MIVQRNFETKIRDPPQTQKIAAYMKYFRDLSSIRIYRYFPASQPKQEVDQAFFTKIFDIFKIF